jgi:hypothetical protein
MALVVVSNGFTGALGEEGDIDHTNDGSAVGDESNFALSNSSP